MSFVVETILEFAADFVQLRKQRQNIQSEKRKLQKVISKLNKEHNGSMSFIQRLNINLLFTITIK